MPNSEYETRENNQSRNKEGVSKNFLLGAIVGGVVGAATALLLAPKAGRELRTDLNDQVNSLLEKTNQISDDVVEKSGGLAAMTKEKTAALSKAVILQSKELVNKAKNFSQNEEDQGEQKETTYISLTNTGKMASSKKDPEVIEASNETDIRKKLEEAQKAFEEEENKIKQ